MNDLLQRVKSFYANLSLKRKLMTIVSISVCLISIASLYSLHIISDAHLRLLEEAVSKNLSYSAVTISDYLNYIEDTSGAILADSGIQSSLITITGSDNPREQTAAYQTLSYSIQEYYGKCKAFYVDYITLYNSKNTIYSNFIQNKNTPEEIEGSVLSLAAQAEGRPVWTYPAGDAGIFLGRQIRNIQSPYFDALGTVVISVDLDRMIQSLNQREGAFPDAQYFIAYQGEIIYHADEVTSVIYEETAGLPENRYKILNAGGHKYFVYSTLIPGQELSYTCYISYDSIFHTASFAWLLSSAIILMISLIAVVFSQSMIAFINRHTQLLVRKMQAYSAQESAVTESGYDYSNRRDEFGLLNRQFDHMADRIQNLIQVNYINELWKKDAQLKALEKQIQPHFLYNTLESINWRAKAAGNTDISSMVESLGSLLRASLSKDTGKWSLEKELDMTDSYITIQKYRFEEHLEYCSCCVPALYSAQIPKYIIQPLVENAIHYGLEECMEVCHIEVNIALDKDSRILHIYVKNNGSQFEEDILSRLRSSELASRGLGIGLINIEERIKLMFGPMYGLTLYNEGELAVAQIDMPYHGASAPDAEAPHTPERQVADL